MYKRILLKLSGEQLAGEAQNGLDPQLISWIAKEVKAATETGVELAIMVGGGNFVRGAQYADQGIDRVTADYMGMLSTVINALALADLFTLADVPARALSSLLAPQIIDDYTPRRALSHLEKGRVIVLAGGIGRPYLTTDTAAVSLALELDCDVIMKATKVDGVYDKDPVQFTDAKRIAQMSFQEAVQNQDIKVMDKAALGLAMDYQKPIVVFDLLSEGNIVRAASGEAVGTLIN